MHFEVCIKKAKLNQEKVFSQSDGARQFTEV